ncbi:hypothetical protein BDB00DRAFT_817077 [Zychaea mexicana]|uniref:uncharacterized protein n=1 Tax=Zychaea mexicana TaxID=64656 RepID=UPI0022FF1057|nr:uncharacterized protein BDB00DRAFT_817077 [Zychaea mexicana]KAI9494792.1 hypothetical protein BDB00DRAFT_817077 [Zychaea mexicana]
MVLLLSLMLGSSHSIPFVVVELTNQNYTSDSAVGSFQYVNSRIETKRYQFEHCSAATDLLLMIGLPSLDAHYY